MARTPAAPMAGDPVVMAGTKYRIKAIGPLSDVAQLRSSFGGREATCHLSALVWDKVAGVWRVAA